MRGIGKRLDFPESFVLGLCDLMLVHEKCVDSHLMDRYFVVAAVRAPHRESPAGNEDHRDTTLRRNDRWLRAGVRLTNVATAEVHQTQQHQERAQ